MPIYTDETLADLRAILEWIAEDSPQRAAQKGAMIDDTCKLLDTMPKLGRVFSGEIRVFTKESWLILYEPGKTGRNNSPDL